MATLATSPLRVKNGHILIVQSQTRLLRKNLSLERERVRGRPRTSALIFRGSGFAPYKMEQELRRIVQITMQPVAAAIKHRS